MSVPKSRRNESRTEYVFQSSMLATKVGQMCSRLPKRWSFTRTQYVIAAANRVMEECVMANAIYATSKTEADKRMCHLQDALGSVYIVEQYVNQLALDQLRYRRSTAGSSRRYAFASATCRRRSARSGKPRISSEVRGLFCAFETPQDRCGGPRWAI